MPINLVVLTGITSLNHGETPRRAVEGRGKYVDDLVLPRMVDVTYVRSPYAHADILAIDVSAAKAFPGVIAVVTGAEIAERMTPWLGVMDNQPALKSMPQYALAVDRALWQGEPVAAIVAEKGVISPRADGRARYSVG